MATVQLPAVLQHLRCLAVGQNNDLSDGQLVQRFAQTRDERAFESLVRRHGPLVHGVCQRILGSGPDEADAFQATFLVLARKAGAIRKPASVGSWLHGIARRLALRLKYQEARRRQCERSLGGLEETALSPTRAVDPVLRASLCELGRILDEEVERLPARQRDVLVFCHLEGLSCAAAARRLGCPASTLKSRLGKARDVLRQRLQRRGITLSVTALAWIGAEQTARAAPPASLLGAAVQTATATAVAPRVAQLAGQILRAAPVTRLTLAAALGLTLLGLAAAIRPGPAPGAVGETVATPAVVTQPSAVKDAQGDPLPAGALARLGSTRWRHGGVTGFVAFLPDGKGVVSAGVDRVFHVWEFPSGKELRRFGPGVHQPLPPAVLWRSTEMPVALSGDGKLLAFHVQDVEIQVYDVETGKKLAALEQEGQLSNLAFSPDGRHVAVRGMFGGLTIWDWKARQAQHISVPHRFILGEAASLVYSPDGKLLAMTSQSQHSAAIQLVDPRKGKGEQVRTLPTDQETYINRVLFAPDGKSLACADRGAIVRRIDLATGKQLVKFQLKERGPVGLAFSRDGKTILTRSMFRQTVSEWDAATGKELRSFGPVGRQDPPHGDLMLPRPALSPDGTTLAFAGVDHSLHFLDLTAGKEVRGDGRPTLPPTALGWRPDGKGLWTQSYGKALRQWDPATGKETDSRTIPVNVYQTVLSADARYLATAPLWEKAGKIIEVATGKEVGQILPRRPEGKFPSPTSMTFSPDGAFLAVRWEPAQQLELYAVPQGKLLHTLAIAATPREMNVNGMACQPVMAFSADGKMLAAYGAPAVLAVWDTATGRMRASLALTAGTPFAGVAFTPDGRCLAVETGAGDVALWELATRKVRRVFLARDKRPGGPNAALVPAKGTFADLAAAPSANVALSPRGELLVYGASAGDIHVWQVQSGQEVATFRGHAGVINAFAFTADGKTLASASADTSVLTWDLRAALFRPLPQRVLTDDEVKACWEALASADARQAFAAMGDLAAAPAQAVALLDQRLRPAPALEPDTVHRFLADLGDPALKVRQKATAALRQLDERAVPAIDKALAGKPALEVRRNLEAIRDALTTLKLSEEKLRSYRAIEVLERLGTPRARQVLQRLADGAPGALETAAARDALRRP